MLEMNEVANILHNATSRSLVILDEIGRGTSTFDGLSIAWAVAEYIHKKIKAKTLFATHYHELTELENSLSGVKNYRVAVKKKGDDITFLRKIVRGGADDSYGIEVAALAGVPQEVIASAKRILKKIENDDIQGVYKKKQHIEQPSGQIGFGDTIAAEIADELKLIDVTTFTPIEALNKLYELANKAKGI
jgi:DNA mismatch repair protein MutS